MRWNAALLSLCCCAAWSQAAPLPASQQREVDRAVAAYEAGHLRAAQAAFETLARRHVPAAEYNLGVMHLRGELAHSDRARGRRLLESAGRAGFVTAQLVLGRALEAQDFGARDLVTAHDWYQRAADAGNAEAQLAMGTAYFLGRGRAQDLSRAAHWFREAAKAGDVGAMYLLAALYEHGDGVDLDLRLARYWYGEAAAAGDPAAPGKLREIDDKLAPPPTDTH